MGREGSVTVTEVSDEQVAHIHLGVQVALSRTREGLTAPVSAALVIVSQLKLIQPGRGRGKIQAVQLQAYRGLASPTCPGQGPSGSCGVLP